MWNPEDGASAVQPSEGGIHRVGNPGESVAISVHVYGPQIEEVDGTTTPPARGQLRGTLKIHPVSYTHLTLPTKRIV